MIDVDYNEYKETLAKNMKLIVENHRLEEVEKEHQKLNGELREEIERLSNIIDELEHKLYQEWLEWKDSDCESIYVRAFEDKAIYDYIQELKGVDKE